MDIHKIVTHPGGAHKDDFLACSVLLHFTSAKIYRREPTKKDLEDPRTYVIDVGREHAPELGNFDHHQLPRDHEPLCALSLVLQHLGLYDDAKKFCDWLECAEWFDSRGAVKTSKWLGIERNTMAKLNSPIDITCLRRFAIGKKFSKGDTIWDLMKMIGDDLVIYIQSARDKVQFLDENAEIWHINDRFDVLFLPRQENMGVEPSAGMVKYIETSPRAQSCVGMVYPDRRGTGYGMCRYNDDERLEFTKISTEMDVHFAHNAGFIAKTQATNLSRLRELLARCWVG